MFSCYVAMHLKLQFCFVRLFEKIIFVMSGSRARPGCCFLEKKNKKTINFHFLDIFLEFQAFLKNTREIYNQSFFYVLVA